MRKVLVSMAVVTLAVLVLSVAACGSSSREKKRESGAQGSVIVNAPPINGPYADAPVYALDGSTHAVVANTLASAQAQFSLVLEPGTYWLVVPKEGQTVTGSPDPASFWGSQQVTVTSGQFTTVTLVITGK